MDAWIATGLRDRRRAGPAACVWAQVWLAHRFRRTFNVGMLPGIGAAAGHADRRTIALVLRPERCGRHHPRRQLHRRQRRRRRADRGQQRQVQREPDPDRPRLRRRLRDGVEDVGGDRHGRPQPARVRPPDRRVDSLRRRAHARSATLDDGGQWDKAVALATGTGRSRPTPPSPLSTPAWPTASTRPAARPPPGSRPQQPGLIVGAILPCSPASGSPLLGRSRRRRPAEGVPMRRPPRVRWPPP